MGNQQLIESLQYYNEVSIPYLRQKAQNSSPSRWQKMSKSQLNAKRSQKDYNNTRRETLFNNDRELLAKNYDQFVKYTLDNDEYEFHRDRYNRAKILSQIPNKISAKDLAKITNKIPSYRSPHQKVRDIPENPF